MFNFVNLAIRGYPKIKHYFIYIYIYIYIKDDRAGFSVEFLLVFPRSRAEMSQLKMKVV